MFKNRRKFLLKSGLFYWKIGKTGYCDERTKSLLMPGFVLSLFFLGVIRSMCIDASGTWIAAGFSSGIFTAIDVRAGILRGQARIHEGEILQVFKGLFVSILNKFRFT